MNGQEAKASKSALSDDVTDVLLPQATSEDVGKIVAVGENGSYELAEAGGSNSKAFVGYIKNITDTTIYVYKDASCTQRFAFAEANSALLSVDSAKLIIATNQTSEFQCFVVGTSIRDDWDETYVKVTFLTGTGAAKTGILYQ